MAVDEAERKMVKTTVEGLIKLLRCHINARQSTESEPEDIKIIRPFIEKLILALLHCCQFNLDNNQYHECLTAVSGSAGCGDEVVLFDDDEELANSVSRVPELRVPIYNAIRQGTMMMVIGEILEN